MKKTSRYKTKKLNFLGEEIQLYIRPYKELSLKKMFPWHLKIIVEKKYTGHNPKFIFEEKKKCSSVIRKVEYELSKSLNIVKMAKIKKKGTIEHHWYLDTAEIDYSNNVQAINKIKSIRSLTFDLNYDATWDRVNSFIKKEVA